MILYLLNNYYDEYCFSYLNVTMCTTFCDSLVFTSTNIGLYVPNFDINYPISEELMG